MKPIHRRGDAGAVRGRASFSLLTPDEWWRVPLADPRCGNARSMPAPAQAVGEAPWRLTPTQPARPLREAEPDPDA